MKKVIMVVVMGLCGVCVAFGAEVVRHEDLQGVDGNGYGTFFSQEKVVVEGVILNRPESMLVAEPGVGYMGGQWQVYIQGVGDDHAGTAVWLGQNYSRVSSSVDYTNEELVAEMERINRDPATGYVFTVGDLVRVTGFTKFYKGKLNINEQHEADAMFDFTVELVRPAVGVVAETVGLDELKDSGDGFIFDGSRERGCEAYQGRLVRVDGVTVVDPNHWGPGATVTVSDRAGRTFPVLLGIGNGYSMYGCPKGEISVIGILDQEASSNSVCKDGYRLWVCDYDGNGLVLTDRGAKRGNLAGDVNGDYKVDLNDLAAMAGEWMSCAWGLGDCL